MNPSRTMKTLMAIIVAYLILLTWFMNQPVVTPVAAEVPEPEVKQGQYTIFQYTKCGWTNRLYVTEYYIEDRIIYYKSREHQGEYMEVPFDDCLIVPEYIEVVDDLMNYGFWEPGGYEY